MIGLHAPRLFNHRLEKPQSLKKTYQVRLPAPMILTVAIKRSVPGLAIESRHRARASR
jgi:hypothetical protein